MTKYTTNIPLVNQSVLSLEIFAGLELKVMMSSIWSNDCHFNAYENSGLNQGESHISKAQLKQCIGRSIPATSSWHGTCVWHWQGDSSNQQCVDLPTVLWQ